MATIGNPNFNFTISAEELRVLVHRLAPEGSFLKGRAQQFLPENHEEIAERLAEELRSAHDEKKFRE